MIRDIILEDKAAFMDMAKDFYTSEALAHAVDSELYEAAFYTAIKKTPFLRALAIEDKGSPVGFALLSFSFATEVGGIAVLIEDIYIKETCRGKGLGSKFMQFVEREYPSAKRFRLEVAKNNEKAMDLYRNIGYETLEYVQLVKDV